MIVIATGHFITDMPEGYTPAHLRALISKAKPDIIACEAPANVAEPWKSAPYELWNVTKPWADEQGIQIVPAGWNEPTYQVQISQMIQQLQAADRMQEFQKNEISFQAASAKHGAACDFMNSETSYKLWREYHTTLHKLYGKDTPWEDWNAKILKNIIGICQKNPGKRVAVVFGGAHSYYFVDQLRAKKDITLIPITKCFPLPEQELATHTKPTDYLKALRLLNFQPGTIPPASLVRLKDNLKKAEQFKELANDCHLFRGKLHLHMQDPKAAIVEFQKLTSLNRETLSAFDQKTPLSEAATLNIAMAYVQLGKSQDARAELNRLIRDKSTSAEIRQAAEQLLTTIPAK